MNSFKTKVSLKKTFFLKLRDVSTIEISEDDDEVISKDEIVEKIQTCNNIREIMTLTSFYLTQVKKIPMEEKLSNIGKVLCTKASVKSSKKRVL